MKTETFEYNENDPVTISKEAREAMKKSRFYNLKKIQLNSLYGIMVKSAFESGKTHAVIKEQSDEKTK